MQAVVAAVEGHYLAVLVRRHAGRENVTAGAQVQLQGEAQADRLPRRHRQRLRIHGSIAGAVAEHRDAIRRLDEKTEHRALPRQLEMGAQADLHRRAAQETHAMARCVRDLHTQIFEGGATFAPAVLAAEIAGTLLQHPDIRSRFRDGRAAPLGRPHGPGAQHQVEVAVGDVAGRAVANQLAALQQQRPRAMAHHLLGGVGHQQHGAALGHQRLETAEALGLKLHVAHRQRLVDDQHLRLDAGCHRKRQAHIHARGIEFDRALDKLADRGERGDLGQPGFDLAG